MTDLRLVVEMFPSWWWRWNFCIVWSDGVVIRSTKSTWGYGKTLDSANRIAQEARRG